MADCFQKQFLFQGVEHLWGWGLHHLTC